MLELAGNDLQRAAATVTSQPVGLRRRLRQTLTEPTLEALCCPGT